MKDLETINREEIGRRIGNIRRREGLSQAEFAKKLNMPVLVTEIAEHGVRSDMGGDIVFDLPSNELHHLLKLISEKFDVPLKWLMYGYDILFYLGDIPVPDDEITLYFPMTISPESLSSEMSDAMILMNNPFGHEDERLKIHKDLFESIVEKCNLFNQYADFSGNTELANLAGKKMLSSINRYRSPYVM